MHKYEYEFSVYDVLQDIYCINIYSMYKRVYDKLSLDQ
jgi:hypothetical protein